MGKVTNKSVLFFFLATSILFLFSYYLTQYFHNQHHTLESEFVSLSECVDFQSVKLLNGGVEVRNFIETSPNDIWKKLDFFFSQSTYFCFVTHNDSVIYWNSNKVAIDNFRELISDNNIHAVNLPSGWYLYYGSKVGNYNIYILDLIKTGFLVNNEFLTPGFNPAFSSCNDIDLTFNVGIADYVIYNNNDQVLLCATIDSNNALHNSDNYVLFLLFFLSYVFLLLFLLQLIKMSELYKREPLFGFTVFILLVIIMRFLVTFLSIPTELKSSSIFANNIFNIPFTKSLGDLIINTTLLIICSVGLFRFFRKITTTPSPSKIILLYTSLWIYILVIVYVLYHTIFDQNISFFSGSIFKNFELFISVLIIVGLNISFYYVIVTYLNSNQNKKEPFFVSYIITFVGVFVIYLISDTPIILLTTTLVITFSILLIKQLLWKYFSDSFLNHLFLLVFLAAISSFVIINAYQLKNEDYQKHIAKTLAIANDSLFENSYVNIIDVIKNDERLKQMLIAETVTTDELLEVYIKSEYFSDFLNKYTIQITICGEDELLEIQPEGDVYGCADYFNTLIEEITIPVIDSTLFRFNSGTESIYYISRITLNNAGNRKLFIEFASSHVPEGLGYPELLIDKHSNELNLSEYSFAKYTDNRLTYKFGDFAYNTYFTVNKSFKFDSFFDYTGYRHFAISISPDGFLIVSKENTRLTMKLVVFSAIFILLALISIIVYLLMYARKAVHLFRLNFKTRLQTFVIATLTLTFVLVAVSTLVYIEDNSRDDLEKQLTEKTNSVLIELQHKLSPITNFKSEDPDFLHQLLRKFSLVFFSDINLYDNSGYLIATSRPEIFEKNLLSSFINPLAYKAIFTDNKLNFITEEKIGSLKYYSAYVPINLNNDRPIGIVNLPYFARQTEFTRSYYIMLSYLINIYVIIGIIGALIAITFSRYLTRPLVLLQKSLATIRIDEHNEKIDWNKKDEIGTLIKEYNLMVDKLEQSTYLLKHSERESAWREIAMQIAHEIKNPLTPMKLNIQYLEKSFKNKDPDFDSKINSISQSLITQIDALDNVAEMFSNFAETRFSDFEKVNLKTIIDSSVNLFDKKNNVVISITYTDADLFTLGFEKDILRAFNNILKNAIQSIENSENGEIKITAKRDSNFITIEVSDNGKGVSEEMKSKIFQPYFTTKTSGTGLGLAIVKNIMNEIGGKVSFESNTGQGTTFSLMFPESS
ncbi:MAG: hypothetical protein CL661_02545 [Bacteroidetes bacterium]|nr:hypothetical protein [Bacteroidota bacterium]